MKILYTTRATAVGGREGRVKSADGVLDLELGMPKALGGAGKAVANPEMLFAAGYAACFESAIRHVARNEKVALQSAQVEAEVGIGPRDDGGGFGLQVKLDARLTGVDQATAEKLVAQADVVCPYSHGLRGNVPVTIATSVA